MSQPIAPPQQGAVPTDLRLDWRTVVVHSVTFKQARQVLSAAVPALAALGISNNLSLPAVIAIFAGVTLLSVLLAVLRWWRFSYQVVLSDGSPGRLVVTQGLLGRTQRVVPIDRIRGIDVDVPWLHRPLGLAVLRVDAAAGGQRKDEVTLDAVRREEAERLRGLLLAGARRAGTPVQVAQPPADGETGTDQTQDAEEKVYARVKPRWLLYAPLVGSYLAVPIAALGVLFHQFTQDEGSWLPASAREWARGLFRPSVGDLLVIGLVLVAALIIGALAAGVVLNWNFVLARRGDHLVAERGLWSTKTASLEIDRLRGYALLEPLGLRLLRAARLIALVTGLAGQSKRGHLLPLGPREEAIRVAEEAVMRYTGPLVGHPVAALRRRLVRAILPGLVLAAAGFAFSWPLWIGIVGLVLAGLGIPLGIDRYRALGHGSDATGFAVRSHSLRRETVVLQRRALVGWAVRESFFQRRSGLASVTALVGVSGGGYTAMDCDHDEGLAWVEQISPRWTEPMRVESSRRVDYYGQPPITG